MSDLETAIAEIEKAIQSTASIGTTIRHLIDRLARSEALVRELEALTNNLQTRRTEPTTYQEALDSLVRAKTMGEVLYYQRWLKRLGGG